MTLQQYTIKSTLNEHRYTINSFIIITILEYNSNSKYKHLSHEKRQQRSVRDYWKLTCFQKQEMLVLAKQPY